MSARPPVSVILFVPWCLTATWSQPNLTAQDIPGVLHGSVIDREGRPLPDALITILGTRFRSVSNSEGVYQITAVPAGAYTVKVEGPGFLPAETDEVWIVAGEVVTADFRLVLPHTPSAAVDDTCPDPVVSHAHVVALATPSPLPRRLLGYPVSETRHGDAAHPLTDSPLGLADHAMVTWVARYDLRDAAVDVGANLFGCANAARAALRRAIHGVPDHNVFTAGGVEVHALPGPSGLTFVFAADELVWWVAGPEVVARHVIAGMLSAPEDATMHSAAGL